MMSTYHKVSQHAQFSPLLCYLIPLRPKYLLQYHFLQQSQSMFLPQCGTKFHTHKNNRQS